MRGQLSQLNSPKNQLANFEDCLDMFESITLIKAKMILFSARFLHNVPLGAPEDGEDDSMAENRENRADSVIRLCFPLNPFFFHFR